MHLIFNFHWKSQCKDDHHHVHFLDVRTGLKSSQFLQPLDGRIRTMPVHTGVSLYTQVQAEALLFKSLPATGGLTATKAGMLLSRGNQTSWACPVFLLCETGLAPKIFQQMGFVYLRMQASPRHCGNSVTLFSALPGVVHVCRKYLSPSTMAGNLFLIQLLSRKQLIIWQK